MILKLPSVAFPSCPPSREGKALLRLSLMGQGTELPSVLCCPSAGDRGSCLSRLPAVSRARGKAGGCTVMRVEEERGEEQAACRRRQARTVLFLPVPAPHPFKLGAGDAR